MVNTCANPACAKPLHYLRDGRVFIFETGGGSSDAAGKKLRHLEHYWLCGRCSEAMILSQDGDGVKVVRKLPAIREAGDPEAAAGVAG